MRGGGGGAVYGLGLIAALVCYWQHAAGFWAHVWAIAEAIPWPDFVICHLLGHLAHRTPAVTLTPAIMMACRARRTQPALEPPRLSITIEKTDSGRTGRPADCTGPPSAEPDPEVSPARSCRLRQFPGSGVCVC